MEAEPPNISPRNTTDSGSRQGWRDIIFLYLFPLLLKYERGTALDVWGQRAVVFFVAYRNATA